MENKITSTTYVPLPPPYQIIKYSGDIAMQIGTLIVTIQKEGNMNGMGYWIETHSHPVVAYENKQTAAKNQQLFCKHFHEGVVWSYVQVKDVSTICLSDSELSWHEFVEFLRADMVRRLGIPLPSVAAYFDIVRLGARIIPPECREYIVKLQTEQRSDGLQAVETPHGSVFALHADASSDETMMGQLKNRIRNYMNVLHHGRWMKGFSVTYTTDEERYRNIVEQLNKDDLCTGKRSYMVSAPGLIIDCVDPYKGSTPENV